MRVVLFACLTIVVTSLITDDTTSQRSASEKEFKEKLEEGYQLLKNEQNANDTKIFLEKLHEIKQNEKDEGDVTAEENEESVEKPHKNGTGETIEEINRENKVGTALFQGDMILTKEQADAIIDDIQKHKNDRSKRQAYRGKNYPDNIWPENKVYYSFYPNASDAIRRVIAKAADAWKKDTCLEFKEVKLEESEKEVPNRIGVYKSSGCFSRVGKIGGIQGLSLSDKCETVGHAAHELGHALGLLHTHMRHDRDQFIRIRWQNIWPDWRDQYIKVSEELNDNYNQTYDYGSIMQYAAASGSRTGGNIMEPYDMNYLYTLGSHIISFYDKLMVNKHYNCLDKCKKRKNWFKPTAKCENGGFPNPNDCYRCVCPSGYGGRLCNERPNTCGETVYAKITAEKILDRVGTNYNGFTRNDEYKMCNYWIEALPGSTVEIKLTSYDSSSSSVDEGCQESGIVKSGNDTQRTGYRFCESQNEGTVLNSTNSVVPIITYSAIGIKRTELSYRIVAFDSKFKCEDSAVCPVFKKLKICTGGAYNDKFRRKVCAKTCGFCM